MRFRHPRLGDEKVVTKFLLLPLWIDFETRWLERVTIRHRVCPTQYGGTEWRPIEFVDEEEERCRPQPSRPAEKGWTR